MMRMRSKAFACCFDTGVARAIFLARSAHVQYVVLCYHGVCDREFPLFTTARLFEQHLRYFKCWGRVASMDELLCFINGVPVPSGPRIRFVITFDDGYQNVVRNAVPLLRKYDVRATVYVNPEWIERAVMPWWVLLITTPQFRKRREGRSWTSKL